MKFLKDFLKLKMFAWGVRTNAIFLLCMHKTNEMRGSFYITKML